MSNIVIKVALAIAFASSTVLPVLAEDVLRVGMTPEPYLPFGQVNAAGEWEGIEADITHVLCERMQVKCEISAMAFDGLLPALKENKLDVVVGAFSITDERKETVDFSASYYTEGTSLVGPKAESVSIGTADAPDGGKILDPKALEGKIVGVQASTVQHQYMTKYYPDIEVKAYDTADNSMADLAAGRIDFVLSPDLYVHTFLATPQGADFDVKAAAPNNKVLGEGVGYVVKKGDAVTLKKVDDALASIKADGTLDKSIAKWVDGKK
ncbi:MAG: amino acid transporter substrate-binding protein [Proteobacteria bacterium]|nr:amino acid transporter substrate-binding protein [Pseudomonadota bacterium]